MQLLRTIERKGQGMHVGVYHCDVNLSRITVRSRGKRLQNSILGYVAIGGVECHYVIPEDQITAV